MAGNKKWINGIGAKLMIILIIASIIPILTIGILCVNSAKKYMEEMVFSKLEIIGHEHTHEITEFLQRKKRDIEILAKQKETVDAFDRLQNFHDSFDMNPDGPYVTNTEAYQNLYDEINPFFRDYLNSYVFYDIFFICAKHGHVMYTVLKEDDLGTNLSTGKYNESALAKLWSKVVSTKSTVMSDYAYYPPSRKNAAFIGAPVFDENRNLVAVVALQLSTSEINNYLTNSSGLGETGDVYLVGNDYLMRSNSRFSDDTDILEQKVETSSVKLGLQDKTGTHIIENHRGETVLSYYSDLGLNELFGTDFEWVIVAEMNKSESFKLIRFLINETIIAGLLLLLIVAIIAWYASKKVTKPILDLEISAKKLAEGDLSHEIEIKTNDEIGALAQSFGIMQKNLREQLKEISEGVNIVSSSASQIISMSSQLASSSAETSTSLSETTSTIEEVKQTAKLSNQNAEEIAEKGNQISEVAQDGLKSTEETISGMNNIKEQMGKIADIIMQLSEKSNSIGEITDNVKDLTEQSNLLAVNASIEAAKAGEYGKGFSVVAQEIKNLADKSKEFTVKISKIVNDIQKEVGRAVMATEEESKVIDSGLELSANANNVIDALAESIEDAVRSNLQIAASSKEQLVGMDQITSAMGNINEASRQIAEGAKQTEESVTELKNLGDKLQEITKKYTL